MNMNIFAPILIYLFIVIMISMFMFKIMKKTVNKKGKYSYGNRVRWIVAGYISLLLICGMVVTFSSAKNRADFKTINIDELDKESAALDNAAVAGKIDTVDKKYIEKKWSFDYRTKSLT